MKTRFAQKFWVGLVILALLMPHAEAEERKRASSKDTKNKSPEELTLEELESELKDLDQDLSDLELNAVSKWFLDNGASFATGGILAFIWNSFAVLQKMKERRDLENQSNEKQWQAFQIREIVDQHKGKIEELRAKVVEVRQFVALVDKHVKELGDAMFTSFADKPELLAQAKAAIDDWNGVNRDKRRSREKLDKLVKNLEPEMSNPKHLALSTWKTSFDALDVDLTKTATDLYQTDTALWKGIKEKYPSFLVKPLQPITPDSKVIPDHFVLDGDGARNRLRRANQALTYDQAVQRLGNHCDTAIAAISGDIAHIGRVSRVVYGVYFVAGAFIAIGTTANNAKESHKQEVENVKTSKRHLEELREKKKIRREEVAKTLESQIIEALKKDPQKDKDAKSVYNFAKITSEVLKRHKPRIRAAITKAYEHDPDFPKIRSRLDSELDKLDDPNVVIKLLPAALPEALRAKNFGHYNLSDAILFLATEDPVYQNSEVFDFMTLFYGGMIQKALAKVRPRVTADDRLTRPISGFDIEPLATDTMRRIRGLPFQPQDPGAAGPTAITSPPMPKPTDPPSK